MLPIVIHATSPVGSSLLFGRLRRVSWLWTLWVYYVPEFSRLSFPSSSFSYLGYWRLLQFSASECVRSFFLVSDVAVLEFRAHFGGFWRVENFNSSPVVAAHPSWSLTISLSELGVIRDGHYSFEAVRSCRYRLPLFPGYPFFLDYFLVVPERSARQGLTHLAPSRPGESKWLGIRILRAQRLGKCVSCHAAVANRGLSLREGVLAKASAVRPRATPRPCKKDTHCTDNKQTFPAPCTVSRATAG